MTEQQIVQAEAEEQAIRRGLDPLMERPFFRLLGEVPKRWLTMVMKLFSMKGVAFGAATYLVASGRIETWAWVVVSLVLIFGEKALQYLKEMRG